MGVRYYTMQKADFDDWITVKILRKDYKVIEKIISKKGGYTGVPDFVRDAIREKLEDKK